MKLYLVLLSLCILSFDAKISDYAVSKWHSLVSPYRDECLKESGANSDDVDKLLTTYVVETEQIHDFVKCAFLKMGMMSADGEFHECAILKGADYLTYKLLHKCINEGSSEKNLSVKSSKVFACVVIGLNEGLC